MQPCREKRRGQRGIQAQEQGEMFLDGRGLSKLPDVREKIFPH